MMYILSHNDYPASFLECGKFNRLDPFLHPSRKLPYFDIMLGIQGSLFITQQEKRYELKPKRFMLLYPGARHYGFQVSEPPLTYYWCHFQLRGDYQLLNEHDLESTFNIAEQINHDSRDERTLPNTYLFPEYGGVGDLDRVTPLFTQLIDLSQRRYYTPNILDYALTLLCMEFTQNTMHDLDQSASQRIQRRKMKEIMAFIRLHACSGLSAADVAGHFRYNADYLSTAFKQETGLSLLQYIHEVQLTEAKQLLVNSSLHIKEIARQVGFFDDKYFMKFFKKKENITPTQYRDAYANAMASNS